MAWILRGALAGANDAMTAALIEAASATRAAVDARVAVAMPDATTTVKGRVELATTAETTAGASSVLAVTPAGVAAALSANEAALRPVRSNAVFIGSSNVVGPSSSSWTTKLCAAMGWTERNYASSGAPWANDYFYNQLTSAGNDGAFSNDSVGWVFLADASNDIRSKNNSANSSSMGSVASRTMLHARTLFSNARVIVLPVIWPADARVHVAGVPGGYQHVWPRWLLHDVGVLRDAARETGCGFIEDTWTWLSGRSDWMSAGGDVHPNADGHTEIARWVRHYLGGGETTPRTGWNTVSLASGYSSTTDGSKRALSWRMDGEEIIVHGAVNFASSTSSFADVGTMPVGIRPPYSVDIQVGSGAGIGTATIFPTGEVRVASGQPAGDVFFAGRFRLF